MMVKKNNILFMLMLLIISTLVSTYAKEEELYEKLEYINHRVDELEERLEE